MNILPDEDYFRHCSISEACFIDFSMKYDCISQKWLFFFKIMKTYNCYNLHIAANKCESFIFTYYIYWDILSLYIIELKFLHLLFSFKTLYDILTWRATFALKTIEDSK